MRIETTTRSAASDYLVHYTKCIDTQGIIPFNRQSISYLLIIGSLSVAGSSILSVSNQMKMIVPLIASQCMIDMTNHNQFRTGLHKRIQSIGTVSYFSNAYYHLGRCNFSQRIIFWRIGCRYRGTSFDQQVL